MSSNCDVPHQPTARAPDFDQIATNPKETELRPAKKNMKDSDGGSLEANMLPFSSAVSGEWKAVHETANIPAQQNDARTTGADEGHQRQRDHDPFTPVASPAASPMYEIATLQQNTLCSERPRGRSRTDAMHSIHAPCRTDARDSRDRTPQREIIPVAIRALAKQSGTCGVNQPGLPIAKSANHSASSALF